MSDKDVEELQMRYELLQNDIEREQDEINFHEERIERMCEDADDIQKAIKLAEDLPA